MKASEVLRRYAQGQRNFQNVNLRGQSFKGQNLSDADFSGADIRGTIFTHTILRGAKFVGAKAGVQGHWEFFQGTVEVAISLLSVFLVVFSGGSLTLLFRQTGSSGLAFFLTGLIALAMMGFVFFAIVQKGFSFQTFATIAVICSVPFTSAILISGRVTIAAAMGLAGLFVFTFAVAGTGVGALAGIHGNLISFIFAVLFAFQSISMDDELAIAGVGASMAAFAVIALNLHVTWRTAKGDEKFASIRAMSVVLGALGGTSFDGADLTYADFSKAILQGTTFNLTCQQQTILMHTCWHDAKGLEKARVGVSILSNPAVRDLLVTRYGYKKSFVDADFRGANLSGVNLREANLKRADLSEATLQNAELIGANLTEASAIGTDFTGACFTEACLESWNIDHTTKLDSVDCQFVFLLEQPNTLGSRDRHPHDPDKIFEKGEFQKRYEKTINLVKILLRNGINREAFAEAFQKVMEDYPEINEASIQAIERKGDDVQVSIAVPKDADKGKIEKTFRQSYDAELKQFKSEIKAELDEFKATQKTLYPIVIHNHNHIGSAKNTMQEINDSSRNINVNRDLNLTNSTLNLGEIIGGVTQAINQIPDSSTPDRPNLKQLLTELKEAIESDTNLQDTDKADLLEQVQNLAQAEQTPEPAQKEGLARKAKKMFEATLIGLPATATIVEACSKLLPPILGALGLLV